MTNEISNENQQIKLDKKSDLDSKRPNLPVDWHLAQGDTCNDPNIDSDSEEDPESNEAFQEAHISQDQGPN